VAAEPLPGPPMIKVNASTKIVAATNTSPRRAQYVRTDSGPTGCSTPLMAPSLESTACSQLEARRRKSQSWRAVSAVRPGSRAAVLRRNEGTRLSSPSDDEVGGDKARSAWSERSERSNRTR